MFGLMKKMFIGLLIDIIGKVSASNHAKAIKNV